MLVNSTPPNVEMPALLTRPHKPAPEETELGHRRAQPQGSPSSLQPILCTFIPFPHNLAASCPRLSRHVLESPRNNQRWRGSKVPAVTSFSLQFPIPHLALPAASDPSRPALLAPPAQSSPPLTWLTYPPVSSCTLHLFIPASEPLLIFSLLARNQGILRSLPGQVLSGEPEKWLQASKVTASQKLSQALMSGQAPVQLHSEMLTTPPSSALRSEPRTTG